MNTPDAGAESTLQERVEQAKMFVDAGAQAEVPNADPVAERTSPTMTGPPRLSMVMRKYRVVTEIKEADLAKQVGITTRQLIAFEAGKDCGSGVLAAILSWVMGVA